MRASPVRRSLAFTLIEVLAAVFLTAVVMTVALTFYVDLSDATDAAAARTRQGRQAVAVLDRLARDLEGAFLVAKPAEVDPLYHPWAFLADGAMGGEAADRVQFMTRNYQPRNRLDHGSDLAMVAWLLEPAEEGAGFELLRAVAPGAAEPPVNEFLTRDDERFMLVAEGISRFAMRFRDDTGEWIDEWDSTQLEQSSLLPAAAELEIAFLPESETDDFDDFGTFAALDDEAPSYRRQVLIPMKPIDVAAILEARTGILAAEEEAAEDEEDFDEEEEDEAPRSEGQSETEDPDESGGGLRIR